MPMVRQPLTIEHALLGFVRRQPMYGYEIYQRLLASVELGLVWSLKQSQVYALLAKLEQEGYLAGSLEAQGARPPRKILRLTEAGATAFAAWVGSPVLHGRDFRLEFLAKLYFARHEGAAPALGLVARQRQASQRRLAELRARIAALPPHSYDWLVLQFRIGQIEAILAWLETCAVWLEAQPTSALP